MVSKVLINVSAICFIGHAKFEPPPHIICTKYMTPLRIFRMKPGTLVINPPPPRDGGGCRVSLHEEHITNQMWTRISFSINIAKRGYKASNMQYKKLYRGDQYICKIFMRGLIILTLETIALWPPDENLLMIPNHGGEFVAIVIYQAGSTAVNLCTVCVYASIQLCYLYQYYYMGK